MLLTYIKRFLFYRKDYKTRNSIKRFRITYQNRTCFTTLIIYRLINDA